MLKFMLKCRKTVIIVRRNLPGLRKEFLDLTGETAKTVRELLNLWAD